MSIATILAMVLTAAPAMGAEAKVYQSPDGTLGQPLSQPARAASIALRYGTGAATC